MNFDRPLDSMLEEYLDGLLSEADRAAFEQYLPTRPDLAATVALQRSIDGTIGRLYEVPDPAESTPKTLPINGPAVAPPSTTDRSATLPIRTRKWLKPLALAAGLALAATAFYFTRPSAPDFKLIPAETLYTRLNTTGFTPAFVCTTEAEFSKLVFNKLGAALFVPASTPGVNVLGWAYGNNYSGSPLGPSTLILLAKVDQENVLVLMEREKFDRRIKVAKETGLNVFRREMNDVVMYEITPLNASRVIDAMKLDKP